MKLLVNLFCSFALFCSLLFISACEDKKNQAFDSGPSPLDVDVIADDEVTLGLKLRADPLVDSITLDWDQVKNAVDYEVSRQKESGNEIIELTGGATHFTFNAKPDSNYYIWVAAINSTGDVINTSKLITVKTSAPEALKFSDVGL